MAGPPRQFFMNKSTRSLFRLLNKKNTVELSKDLKASLSAIPGTAMKIIYQTPIKITIKSFMVSNPKLSQYNEKCNIFLKLLVINNVLIVH